MIRVKCLVHIDNAKGKPWPTFLPEGPLLGDCIRPKGFDCRYELIVKERTWCEDKDGVYLELALGQRPGCSIGEYKL